MASSVPLVPNFDYVVIRLKMAESVNSLVGTTLLCHYGETNYIFPKFLHEYTQEFLNSYSYWKDDISVNAAAYLYIGGLKVGALRTDRRT